MFFTIWLEKKIYEIMEKEGFKESSFEKLDFEMFASDLERVF